MINIFKKLAFATKVLAKTICYGVLMVIDIAKDDDIAYLYHMAKYLRQLNLVGADSTNVTMRLLDSYKRAFN